MKYQSPGNAWSPLYFLGALGAGGLAVSFFMYLLWLTPHEGASIATFDTVSAAFADGSLGARVLIVIALAGILTFSVWHVRLVIWNFREYARWTHTPEAGALRAGNGETQFMTIPLTLAMSVNVGFILGAVFVPGLWGVREVLFPLALAAFAAIGVYAFRLYLAFLARVLTEGGYSCEKNNGLGQMISVFAFAMTGVGFSAAAAMSHTTAVVVIAYAGAVFFVLSAIILGVLQLVLGFRAMMEHRAAVETTPTLWIVIPLLTVIGIAIYRLKMSMGHNFNSPVDAAEMFAFLVSMLAAQVLFGLIGWAVMQRNGYFGRWVFGPEKSAGSYSLVCPGVGLFVFANFFVHAGLRRLGVVEQFSLVYWALMIPLIGLQIATIALFVRLNGKLLSGAPEQAARAPAVAAAE